MGHISWQDKQRACLPLPVLRLGAFCILAQIIQKVLALSIQLNVFFPAEEIKMSVQLYLVLLQSAQLGSHNYARH